MQKYRRPFSERAPKTVSWESGKERCVWDFYQNPSFLIVYVKCPGMPSLRSEKRTIFLGNIMLMKISFLESDFFFFRQKTWIILNASVCRRKPSTTLSLNTDEEVGIIILCIIYRCSPRRSKHQNVSKFVYCYSESSTGAVVNPTTLGHCRHHNLNI